MRHGHDTMDGLNGNLGLAGLDPMWGAAIASGIGTAGAIGARFAAAPGSAVNKWSEGIGLFAGIAAAAGMWAFPATSDAGKLGLAVVVVNQGLRLLEQVLRGGGAPVGWVIPQQEQMHGGGATIGMPSMQQMNGGLGHAMAVNQPPRLAGGATAGPMQDNGHPPNVQMMGGQANSFGLASLYGATITGARG